jgi:hypothetical protein
MLERVEIERIVFGVRYQPRYVVLDRMGTVVDQILRAQGTPFGPETFPYSSREAGEHALLNDKTGDSLRITQSDAIVDMAVGDGDVDGIERLSIGFSAYVLDNLREVAHLRDIARYGVLFKLAECSSVLRESPVEHFLSRDFRDARSVSLRFTRRLPTGEALAKRGVNDYRNVIYTVKQSEDGRVLIWLDYQEYFDPQLSGKEWAERPFGEFVTRGIGYFQGEFRRWLQMLLRPDEAA